MKNSLKYIFLGSFFYLLFCGFYFPFPNEVVHPQERKVHVAPNLSIPSSFQRREFADGGMEQPEPLEYFLRGILAVDHFSRSA